MTLGERIRYYRELNGFTQKEVAERLGTSPQNVHKYEKNIITNVPLSSIEIMASMFSISPLELTGWNEKLPVNTDEEDLNLFLTNRLIQLTPDELEKVDSFVQGLLASRQV